MDHKPNALRSNNLLSTSLIKAFAILLIIINHTLIFSVPAEQLGSVNKHYFLPFWLYQAVSLFIVVTGIHYTRSIEKMVNESKKNWGGVFSWYNKKVFARKFLRLWIPYTIMQLVWLLDYIWIKNGTVGKKTFFYYISGGMGPGGYYTLCIIQILVVFPILYYLIKKCNIIGLIFIIAVNILYEMLVKYGWVTASFNRLCCIRLFTGLAFGIIIFLFFDKIKETAIPWIWFIVGVGVLIWYSWGEYHLQFVSSWVSSSFAVMPYSAAIVWFIIVKEERLRILYQKYLFANRLFGMMMKIGKSTYHIFLVQQLYFCLNIYDRKSISLLQASLIDVFVCVIFGYIFYWCYTKCEMVFKRKMNA